ncbi:MAG TPA: GyrI-like domain-containing protein [Xanthobacteraceae bacterium]
MVHRRFVLQALAAVLLPAKSERLFAQAIVRTQPIDPFGQEITLAERPIVYASGTGEWETAYETLTAAFRVAHAYFDEKRLRPSGPAMTIYTAMDDTSFNFQAAIPVSRLPESPSQQNMRMGKSPGGKALKFVHRGSFKDMTNTYDEISHYVEDQQLAAKELLIEEYVTDLLTTPADRLVVNIFVPLE